MIRTETPPFKAFQRYIQPTHNGLSSMSQTATAGRVYLTEFEICDTQIVDAIAIRNEATAAGNVIVGIYGPCTSDNPTNASLVVESASTALSGTSTGQIITFTPTTLQKGYYFLALEFSDGTHTFGRLVATTIITGLNLVYDRGGGFGALTNPCPATTSSGAVRPYVYVRVQ